MNGEKEEMLAALRMEWDKLLQKGRGKLPDDRSDCQEALWKVILAYEGETFTTMKGLEFTYQIKKKRNGERSNEIAISRKEKTITRSTVEMSLDRVFERSGSVARPKQIGTFGASYLYPMFLRFGLIGYEKN